jgi:hypothetical protein
MSEAPPVTVTFHEPAPWVPAEDACPVTAVSDGEFVQVYLGDLREWPVEVLAQMLALRKAQAVERGEEKDG